jgi:hypothetical protein
MAVTSIQNVGGFKGGDTGCLEAQRKPSEGEERARKACSTQPTSSNTLRKSSYELSAPVTSSLNRFDSVDYNEITSVLTTVDPPRHTRLALTGRATLLPLPHAVTHYSPPQNYFPEFDERN